MNNFESEVIQRIAVLETKMENVLDAIVNKNSPALTPSDKWKYGGLIAAVTTLINVVASIVQGGI